jgi:hypothetical protein
MSTAPPPPISARTNLVGVETQQNSMFFGLCAFVVIRGWMLLAKKEPTDLIISSVVLSIVAFINLMYFQSDPKTKLLKIALVGASIGTLFSDLLIMYISEKARPIVAWGAWIVLVGVTIYCTQVIFSDVFDDPNQTALMKRQPRTANAATSSHNQVGYQKDDKVFISDGGNYIEGIIRSVKSPGIYLVQYTDSRKQQRIVEKSYRNLFKRE